MKTAFGAGVAYFALVFAVGFALGTVRVLILVPRLGALYSGLIELPIILTAAWFICRWLVNRFKLDDRWSVRFTMGATAFMLLMVAELSMSLILFDRSVFEHFSFYRSAHALLGLAGQVVFALFPMLVERARSSGKANKAPD